MNPEARSKSGKKKQRSHSAMSHPSLVNDIEMKEICPCGSDKPFAYCCGRDVPCDCRSGLTASECCYQLPEEEVGGRSG